MATRIPITKEISPFEDKQKKIWEDMEHDMEKRRREWEGEIDKMRKEFFQLRPEKNAGVFDSLDGAASIGNQGRLPSRMIDDNDGKPVIEKDEQGQPVFTVKFNMKDYRPEEINVKMDTNKIMVTAKHVEKGVGASVSREYNREVNIPREVDPLTLSCTLNPDGFLVFHAPLPAPKYNAIKEGRSSSPASQSPSNVVKTSTNYHSTSTGPRPQVFSQREQQQQQSPQQNQVRTHIVHHAPPTSKVQTVNSKSFGKTEPVVQEEHVVPSFKPPPDLSQVDMFEKTGPQVPSYNSSQLNQSSSASPLYSNPPSHAMDSHFPKPPPFSSLNSTFPAGPIFSDSASQAQLSTPIVTSNDGKFQLTLPIEDFKPEELTVKTQDRKVIICAKREVKSGNRSHTSEMSREHSLPDNVDPLTVKAFFTDTNNLIVEAPFIRN